MFKRNKTNFDKNEVISTISGNILKKILPTAKELKRRGAHYVKDSFYLRYSPKSNSTLSAFFTITNQDDDIDSEQAIGFDLYNFGTEKKLKNYINENPDILDNSMKMFVSVVTDSKMKKSKYTRNDMIKYYNSQMEDYNFIIDENIEETNEALKVFDRPYKKLNIGDKSLFKNKKFFKKIKGFYLKKFFKFKDEDFEALKEDEEFFDDENTDDLDEIDDAEKEDGIKVVDADDKEDIIKKSDDEYVNTNFASDDLKVETSLLMKNVDEIETDEDREKKYSALRAKFLNVQRRVPVTFGYTGSNTNDLTKINSKNHSTSDANSSFDGGADETSSEFSFDSSSGAMDANGDGSIGETLEETYLYGRNPVPTFSIVDLRHAILNSDAENGYKIKTPEDKELLDNNMPLIANEDMNHDLPINPLPYVKIGEGVDTVLLSFENKKANYVNEGINYAYSLEDNNGNKQLFVTNESNRGRIINLLQEANIKNEKAVCEDCGSTLSTNESDELVCSKCDALAEEIIYEAMNDKLLAVCEDCGNKEEVDENVNEMELVCEHCGSEDVLLKPKEKEKVLKENLTPEDIIRFALVSSNESDKRVEIVVEKTDYHNPESLYNSDIVKIRNAKKGKGFKKIVVQTPEDNTVLMVAYTSNKVSKDGLIKYFSNAQVQRVVNEANTGLLEGYLNVVGEIDTNIQEELNSFDDIESLEEELKDVVKNDLIYDTLEEDIDSMYDELVLEFYENVDTDENDKVKKFILESINNGSDIVINENKLISDDRELLFENLDENEMIDNLKQLSNLEQNLFEENRFRVL